ncbi:hypothetical protein [Kingella oralis]
MDKHFRLPMAWHKRQPETVLNNAQAMLAERAQCPRLAHATSV